MKPTKTLSLLSHLLLPLLSSCYVAGCYAAEAGPEEKNAAQKGEGFVTELEVVDCDGNTRKERWHLPSSLGAYGATSRGCVRVWIVDYSNLAYRQALASKGFPVSYSNPPIEVECGCISLRPTHTQKELHTQVYNYSKYRGQPRELILYKLAERVTCFIKEEGTLFFDCCSTEELKPIEANETALAAAGIKDNDMIMAVFIP